MTIKEIGKQAYKNAVRLGKIGNRTDLEKLKDIQSEYIEAFVALNNGNHADWEAFNNSMSNDNDFKFAFELAIKDTYEDELTDLLKVVLTLMEDCGMDKEKHFKYKNRYNQLRDDHK